MRIDVYIIYIYKYYKTRCNSEVSTNTDLWTIMNLFCELSDFTYTSVHKL